MSALNSSDTSSKQDAVRVVCRARPQNDLEIRSGGLDCLKMANNVIEMEYDSGNFSFPYDRVFPSSVSQKDVFDYVGKPIIHEIFSGFNSTIIAYGQTSSGKTYTMEGPDIRDSNLKGIIPRCIEELFEQTQNQLELGYCWSVRVSYVEIYMERIRDLLDESKVNLQIREDAQSGVFVAGATEIDVACSTDVMNIMSHGAQLRATAATGMNEGSSRSHSVFFIHITGNPIAGSNNLPKKTAKLVLVDLAGSEMVRKTHATGQTLEEAKMINKSLSALGQVINALTDDKTSHVPYRDSKLTRMLQDSLGGNSKTTLVINISPSSYNAAETLSTLRFGSRAKAVKNQAVANEEKDGNDAMRELLVRAEEALEAQKRQIIGLEDKVRSIRNLSLSLYTMHTKDGSAWRNVVCQIILDAGGSVPPNPEPAVVNNDVGGLNKDDLLREARDLVMHSHSKYKLERERADRLERALKDFQLQDEEKLAVVASQEPYSAHTHSSDDNQAQIQLEQLISIHRDVLNRLYHSELEKRTLKNELSDKDKRLNQMAIQLQQAVQDARNDDWSETVQDLKRIRDRMVAIRNANQER